MKVSKEAVAEIVRLRKEGFELDFSKQGQTESGLDFCYADDGFQGWIIYADGAVLGRGVDYMSLIYTDEEDWASQVAHEYAVAIGAA